MKILYYGGKGLLFAVSGIGYAVKKLKRKKVNVKPIFNTAT